MITTYFDNASTHLLIGGDEKMRACLGADGTHGNPARPRLRLDGL